MTINHTNPITRQRLGFLKWAPPAGKFMPAEIRSPGLGGGIEERGQPNQERSWAMRALSKIYHR